MKKRLTILFAAILFAGFSCYGADYYVSTSGNDGNSGSQSSPFKTLQKAIEVVSAGDYIYLRGGTHSMTTSSVVITKNGSSSSNINVFAYGSETPVLSFDDNENSSSRGIVMDGDYWHWKGVTIEKAGDNGMLLSGNNNTIENCVFRKNNDTGLQLSRYSGDADQISEWPSNNLIVGCEAYDNADSDSEDADGFAAKLTCGTGNVFRSCVAHHNIDDGWDLYTKSETGPIGKVIFEDCIAHNNGILTDGATSGGGDKNGFKLGSSSNTVDHELRRCIAYSNGKHGFTDNGNIGNIKFYNLTSYDNGDYNYHTRDNASHTFRNCITLDGNHTDRIVGDAPTSCNGFDDTDTDWTISVSSSDFQTLSPGPNSDPTSNGFLNLASSSSLIDAGCSASGVSGNGTLDLGAIEYGGVVDPPPTGSFTLSTSVSGSGSVSGAGTYNEGTTASITASASSGWTFSNWTGDASGTSTSTSVYMNSNKSVTAVFTEDGGTTDPPPAGDYDHNFTVSGTSSSFYDISGNLSTSKGTVTYAGLTLTQCLKIESSTSISFNSGQDGTLTLVFNDDYNGGINIDGTSQSASSGILTTSLAAGNHTLTKDNVANLYYISLATEGGTDPTTFTLATSVNGQGSVNPGSGTYEAGTSVSITASPSSGWQFDNWSGAASGTNATTSVTMNSNLSVTANFSEIPVNCDPSAITSYISVNGGTWNQTNTASLDEGGSVKFGPQPSEGGAWSWSGPNGFSSSSREVELTNVQIAQSGSYTATYTNTCGTSSSSTISLTVLSTDISITATIQENETGFCGVDGSIDNNNSGFTGDGFANTSNANGNGVDWAINGNGGSYTFQWRYANGSSDNRTGILYLNGNAVSTEDFVSTGSWTSWTTTSVTIDNAPAGFVEVRLEANQGSGLGNIDYLAVTGSGVSAADCDGVVPTTYTLSTSVNGSGNISGAGTYNEGTVVSLTATPSSGYELSEWSGVDASNGVTATVTMNANRSVSATFTQIPVTTYALTTTINGQGSVNPSSGTYEAGTSVSMTATAASGWQFDNWSGGSTSNPATVVMDANKNITANFSQIVIDQSITIQENQTGFCGVDGTVDNNNSGFTGDGFANTSNSLGNGVDWKVDFGSTGTYSFEFRYASGSDRPANLMVNGSTVVSNISFPSTGSWTSWSTVTVTANISAGISDVRLQSTGSSGLGNIDYMEVSGAGVSAADCDGTDPDPETFTLNVSANPSAGGSVSLNPSGGLYEAGTLVTLTASASSNYTFSSWSGASGSSTTTVTVNSNMNVAANFTYDGGIEGANFALAGWATQDGGTTGGSGGTTVTASTGDEILYYIDQQKDNLYPDGLVIMVTGTITPGNTSETKIDIKDCRNVSLIGAGSGAEFNGIGIKVYKAGNVIIRNVKVHHVLIGDKDCISIEGPADHIWVDHCELYNEYDGVGKDDYDALLDAKAESEYITYSWNYLHDSWKTSLVGSSESDTYDRKITMHHNYYRNCYSRLPLFRGGNGHVFNNYFKDIHSTGINSRLGACIRIEGNYFDNVLNPYVSAYSDELGGGELINNTLVNCSFEYSDDVHEIQSCSGYVPYNYSDVLNSSSVINSLVPANAGVGKLSDPASYSVKSAEGSITAQQTQGIESFSAYPNPFSGSTTIKFSLGSEQELSFRLYDMSGRVVDEITANLYTAGENEVVYNNPGLKSGIYILRLQNGTIVENERLVIE